VIRITNRKQPFDDWRIGALFQVDEHHHNMDLDIILSYMCFNMEWRPKLTIQLVDRYDLVMNQNYFFSIFAPGFKFIANETIVSISHDHFRNFIGNPSLNFQHLVVNRYDHCEHLHILKSKLQCEIATLSLLDFPTQDVFEIISFIRNLKRLEIMGELYDNIFTRTVPKKQFIQLNPQIAHDFISRQQVDFSMEIAEVIYQNKPYSYLFKEILRELNRIQIDRMIHFLSGDVASLQPAPPAAPIVFTCFFNHRNFDRNLIGMISSMVGIRQTKNDKK
jgi:hypothetical protein